MTIVDLPKQNAYGESFVKRTEMIYAMNKIGLKLARANWRVNSSAVRFQGEIDGIQVELEATAWEQMPGSLNFRRVKSSSPHTDIDVTHFMIKGYIPSCVHLRGKGRDGKAREIHQKIALAIIEGNAL